MYLKKFGRDGDKNTKFFHKMANEWWSHYHGIQFEVRIPFQHKNSRVWPSLGCIDHISFDQVWPKKSELLGIYWKKTPYIQKNPEKLLCQGPPISKTSAKSGDGEIFILRYDNGVGVGFDIFFLCVYLSKIKNKNGVGDFSWWIHFFFYYHI